MKLSKTLDKTEKLQPKVFVEIILFTTIPMIHFNI